MNNFAVQLGNLSGKQQGLGNMTENPQRIQYAKQAIMLDLSLFVLDILDADKIKQKPEKSDHIIEVPGALTLMMRDAESGSPILFLFIYSLLKKLSHKYTIDQAVTDQRLRKLINAQDYEIREFALTASKRLFDEFLPLIEKPDTQTKTIDNFSLEQEKISKTLEYSIHRHDQISGLSSSEQTKLQEIYTRRLNLPRHNLFDLYFAQLYHAQLVGFENGQHLPERTISLDDEIFKVVSEWKGENELDPIAQRNVINSNRHFISWFRKNYFRDNRDEIIYDASHEIPLSVILSIPAALGTPGLAGVAFVAGAVTLITLTGETIGKGVIKAPDAIIPKEKKKPYLAFVYLVTILCALTFPFLFKLLSQVRLTAISSSVTDTPQPLFTPTLPIPTATYTAAITPTNTLFPTWTPSPSPINTQAVYSSNYCLYLTQPNDTAQSISNWFGISEATYRAENNSHSGTELTQGQIVTISAPCCNAQYSSWHTYEVKQGDRLYNIATLSGISVNDLAYANHITNQEYIQTGQMLCVP